MNEKDQRNKHDLIPNWAFDLPEDKKPFTPGHDKLDRADMEKATGMPTRATLEGLSLGYVADDLAKRGLLP